MTRASCVALGLVSAFVGVAASLGVASASTLPVDGGVLQFWEISTEVMATAVETEQTLPDTDGRTPEVDTSDPEVLEAQSAGPSSQPEATEPAGSEPVIQSEPTTAPAKPSSGSAPSKGDNDVPMPSSTDPTISPEMLEGGTGGGSATGDPAAETSLP